MNESDSPTLEEILLKSKEYLQYEGLSNDLPAIPLSPQRFFSPINVSMPSNPPNDIHSSNIWLSKDEYSKYCCIDPSFKELVERNKGKETILKKTPAPPAGNLQNKSSNQTKQTNNLNKSRSENSKEQSGKEKEKTIILEKKTSKEEKEIKKPAYEVQTTKIISPPPSVKLVSTTVPKTQSSNSEMEIDKETTKISVTTPKNIPNNNQNQMENIKKKDTENVLKSNPPPIVKPLEPKKTSKSTENNDKIKREESVSKKNKQTTMVNNDNNLTPLEYQNLQNTPFVIPSTLSNISSNSQLVKTDIPQKENLDKVKKKKEKSLTPSEYENLQRTAFVIPSGIPVDDYESDSSDDMVVSNDSVLQNNQKANKSSMPIRYSSLTAEEHVLFIELQRKFQLDQIDLARNLKAPQRLNLGERNLFLQMKNTVQQERAEYQKWLITNSQVNKDKYLDISKEIESKINEILEEAKNRVSFYPRYYKKIEQQINLNSQECQVTANDPILKHAEIIHERGIVPSFKVINQEKYPFSLPKNISFLPEEKTPTTNLENPLHWKKLRMPDISKDDIVEDILQKVQIPIQIVISSSSMQTLFDNIGPNFDQQWEIPITIKTIKSNQKIVLIDKPFPKHKLTIREKNTKYLRYAFQHFTLETKNEKNRVFPISGGANDFVEKKLHQEGHNLTYNTWTFGDLCLLVRCSIHGILFDQNNPKLFRYVGVKSKMEYQLDNNSFEVISPSESARWWIYSFLRPDAHLMLAHGNFNSNLQQQIVKVNYLTNQNILEPMWGFKPHISSKFVYLLFKKLIDLPEGQFLISHSSNSPNIEIFSSVEPPEPISQPKNSVNSSDDDDDSDEDLLKIIDEEDDGGAKSSTKKVDPKQQEKLKNEMNEFLKTSYDLHQVHKTSGASDTDTIPFLMPQWNSQKLIPYTFPIAPQKVACGKRKARERRCYAFMKNGSCSKGDACSFAHSKSKKSRKRKRTK